LTVIRYNGKIYRYVYGKGLYLDGIFFCGEDTDFYREVMDYISENEFVEIGTTFKVKYPTYEHLHASQPKPLKNKVICKNCGKKVCSTKTYDHLGIIMCPNCGLDIKKDNRQAVYDWFNDPNHPGRRLPKAIDEEMINSMEYKRSNKMVFKRNRL
jgi:transcription elongation factor Elf1